LRGGTRRYSSQRDEFYHAEQIRRFNAGPIVALPESRRDG
jgi:hypothetical protein